MSDPIFCPAQTYPRTRDNPAEFCETEVEDYGTLCPAHEDADRGDADYDHWIESKKDH